MLLDGIRVIELGQALAGPLAGMIFADLGADVIKVEKPGGGDDARLWGPPFVGDAALSFRTWNRNKRGVTCDLKGPEGVERLKSLVREADVFIQNLRPGVVEQLGIGPDDLLAVNPRLVYCSISAFGNKGPLKSRPGFDPLCQAYGGVMSLTGREGEPPTFCGPAINDKATGMWLVIGALAALERRRRTGKGGVVDTSLFESSVSWVDNHLGAFLQSGTPPVRHGTGSANLVPYQVFATADRPICIAAANDRLFAKFAAALGRPEWSSDERFARGVARRENRAALVALIEAELVKAPRAHWVEALEKAGVPVSEVNDIPELARSEQLEAVDIMARLPDGAEVVMTPIAVDGERPRVYRDSPKLGEHDEEVFGG